MSLIVFPSDGGLDLSGDSTNQGNLADAGGLEILGEGDSNTPAFNDQAGGLDLSGDSLDLN